MKSKPPSAKIYTIVPGNRYAKDVRRLKKSGANLAKLEKVIERLASGENLPASSKDHELRGDLKGIRECHIAPDWLLLYRKEKQNLILLLIRTGDHRTVLGIE